MVYSKPNFAAVGEDRAVPEEGVPEGGKEKTVT